METAAAIASPGTGTTTPRLRACTLVGGQSSIMMSPAITEMSTPHSAYPLILISISATANPMLPATCTWNPDMAVFPEPTTSFHLAFINYFTGNIIYFSRMQIQVSLQF